MNSIIHRAKNICKKQLLTLLLACAMLISAAPLQAMALDEKQAEQSGELPAAASSANTQAAAGNWGFETGDLSGWTVLTPGWGADGQGKLAGVVSAVSEGECETPTNQSGSYHLSGLHNGIPGVEGWAVRSPGFLLSGSGWISVKMGGEAAAVKVFLSDGTQVGYYRQSRYNDTNYPYLSQGGAWNEMATYAMDLSEYLGKEMYLVLCDEVVGSSAYAVFDDVVTGYDAAPDPASRFDTVTDGHKKGDPASEVRIPWVKASNSYKPCTENNVQNGGFESGDLTGWTVLTKGFNASTAVVSERTYWAQELPYNQSGDYHLNGWNTGIPEAEGWAVRSSTFVLGGSGYISVKMGGNAAVAKVFLTDGTQVGYYRNFRFHDTNFPYISKGGAWCDMATYVIDLSDYLGKEMYIELHDEVITDGWANAFFDDVVTFYETAPDASRLSDKAPDGHNSGESPKLVYIPWVSVPKTSAEYANQIPNGGFETGDLSGWTIYGSGFPIKNGLPAADSASTYWDQELPFNKSGSYFLNGWALSNNEASTWRVRSTPFTLSGSGWISVKMGGHAAAVRVYRLDGTMVGEFDQSRFCDKEFPYISKGGSWCEMATYLLDLTQNIGEVLYIELCDDSISGGWANAFFDDVVTYYETVPTGKTETVNDGHQPGEKPKTVKIEPVVPLNNLYSPRNGGFEMGNLTGWTLVDGAMKLDIAVLAVGKSYDLDADTDKDGIIDEWRTLPYNISGNFIITGHDATWEESDTWTLRSTPFTLAGSGYISVKMGGATAAFQVRTVKDNKIVAYCEQRRFNDVNFPHISEGGSWRDMAVYVMDLSQFLGEKLVIELMDEDRETGWANAYFDDVIAYYPQKPTTKYDTVIDGYKIGYDEPKEIEIPWIYLDGHEYEMGNRFPLAAPSVGGISGSVNADDKYAPDPEKPEETVEYKIVNLYTYFQNQQGLNDFQFDASKLTFTKVKYYDGTNNTGTGIIADYSSLRMKEGSYVIDYRFEQGGVTRTGSFTVNVQPSNPDDLPNTVFNGGFETGNMAGWMPLTTGFNAGTAVISAETYWAEELPYNQEGEYHLNGWNTGIAEGDTWAVRSSTFKLGGSGYISVRMGGRAAAVRVYKAENDELIGYYKQTRFVDRNYPNVAVGSWADMGTYFMDLHAAGANNGDKLYIELCDEAVSGGWANAYFDEVVTYYETKPDWENGNDSVKNGTRTNDTQDGGANGGTISIPWQLVKNRVGADVVNPESKDIINGDFEYGDLIGWTVVEGEGFRPDESVYMAETYWNERLPYNQEGNFHLDGWNTGIEESKTWAIRSSTFTLQGSGYISVRMGGHAAAVKVYTDDGTLVGHYKQTRFADTGFPNVAVGSWADMATYVMDLSEYIGQKLYIELCDEVVVGWANAFFDDVVTYYARVDDVSGKYDTVNNSKDQTTPTVDIYWRAANNLATPSKSIPENAQVENGGFETGDLTGWTPLTEGFTADTAVRSDETWDWGEKMPFNQAGNYHLDSRGTGIAEVDGWAVRSSNFTLQGSGFISVRMGGRTAAVKVFLTDGTLVGYYKANRFSDTGFPDVTQGSWNDMGTYVMDLSDYIGNEMYIELHDEADGRGDWAHGFFDEIVTYYKDAPNYTKKVDLVNNGNSNDKGVVPSIVTIPWQKVESEPVTQMLDLEETVALEEQPDAVPTDAAAPTETETPAEPASPTDPETPVEPVEPAEPEVAAPDPVDETPNIE